MGGVICVREGDGGVISIGYFGMGAITVLPAIDKGDEEVGGDEVDETASKMHRLEEMPTSGQKH